MHDEQRNLKEVMGLFWRQQVLFRIGIYLFWASIQILRGLLASWPTVRFTFKTGTRLSHKQSKTSIMMRATHSSIGTGCYLKQQKLTSILTNKPLITEYWHWMKFLWQKGTCVKHQHFKWLQIKNDSANLNQAALSSQQGQDLLDGYTLPSGSSRSR